MRVAVRISYLGTRFSGWQVQKGQPGGRTVQGELEETLSRVFHSPVTVHGAGRTDAGVHATGQVAHFDVPRERPEIPPLGIMRALNSMLSEDVRVNACQAVSEGFHARFDSVAKCYRYRLRRGDFLPPFEGLVEALAREKLDVAAMKSAALAFLGTHDFGPFSLTGSPVGTTVRTIFDARLEEQGETLHFVVTGSGFLRGMVRRLAGTLREVGRGRMRPGEVMEKPGPTAEARGLTLEHVFYEVSPFPFPAAK